MVFLLIAGAVIRSGAFEDGHEGALGLYVETRLGESDGEGWVYVCADLPLYELSGGGAAAFGLTLELSEGWSFGEVTACEGAEGMTVTVGEDGNSLKILLDGRPPRMDEVRGGRLLRVAVIRSTENVPLAIRIHADGGFYYINEDGEICSRPISAEGSSLDATDGVSEEVSESAAEPQESTAPRDDITTETVFPQESETEMETQSDTQSQKETEPTVTIETGEVCCTPSAYAGCQETPVRDGEYAVRLLFSGDVPAIWVEGGGYLTVEITRTHMVQSFENGKTREYAGNWSVCTLRGLKADAGYTFFLNTEQGTVRISYENGRFLGHISKD